MFSGDPLDPLVSHSPQPPATAPPFYDPLEAKDLMPSLYLLSDVLSRVRITTANDIADLKTKVATLEALAAHRPTTAAATKGTWH